MIAVAIDNYMPWVIGGMVAFVIGAQGLILTGEYVRRRGNAADSDKPRQP